MPSFIELPLTARPVSVPRPKVTDEYLTPEWILALAREALGVDQFDLDPASTPEANLRVRARRIYTAEEDGLKQHWRAATVWLNPPFSYPLVQLFVDKLLLEYAEGSVGAAVCLTNSSTSANWYHWLLERNDAMCVLNRRIQFDRPSTMPGPPGGKKVGNQYSQTVWYLGDRPERFVEIFDDYGWAQRRIS